MSLAKINAERVAKGIKFLDRITPYWLTEIDLNALNIQSVGYCVLGQVEPRGRDYEEWITVKSEKWGVKHGFTATSKDGLPVDKAYAALTDAWEIAILDRQTLAGHTVARV